MTVVFSNVNCRNSSISDCDLNHGVFEKKWQDKDVNVLIETMNKIIIAGLILLAATPVLAEPETKHTVKGVLSVLGGSASGIELSDYAEGSQCVVLGAASDLNNLSISVRDGSGNIIGTGETGIGTVRRELGILAYCDLPFVIENLPKTDFYSIKLGRRGTFEYSYSQMIKENWEMGLTFGL